MEKNPSRKWNKTKRFSSANINMKNNKMEKGTKGKL
jgi:hypothetical protein